MKTLLHNMELKRRKMQTITTRKVKIRKNHLLLKKTKARKKSIVENKKIVKHFLRWD